MELKEHPLFVTSVFVTYLNNINNEIIIESAEKVEKTIRGNLRSNSGGYQSIPINGDNFDNYEILKLFQNYIVPAAKKIGNSWGIPNDLNRFIYWYNINRKNNYNKTHSHPNSYISGVYYAKVPKNSGNIVFERSQNEADRIHFITEQLVNQKIEVNNTRINTEHWFVPEENLLLLFPGHLMHYVNTNETEDYDDRRISISFNFF